MFDVVQHDQTTELVEMVEDDLDQVLAIERQCFRPGWTRKVFADELQRSWAYLKVLRRPRLHESPQVLGYCNYWLVRDEVHLLTIAVHPNHRFQGHGSRLMRHLLMFAQTRQCRFVTLEVRRSNEAALSLYRGCGFASVGLRPKYYVEDGEDAIVMTLEFDA